MKGVVKKIIFVITVLPAWLGMYHCSPSRSSTSTMVSSQKDSPLITELLGRYPNYFDSILQHKDEWNVQVIYTQISRDQQGNPVFTDHYYNIGTDRYFYPASTVKLPVAV